MASIKDLMNEDQKNVFVSRYEDLQFIDDVDHVKCVRCLRVAIHHYYTNCQHVVCKNCKYILGIGGRYANKCPVCKANITEIGRQDIDFERKVNAIKVSCPNKKYGCPFSGTLKDTAKHLKACRDTLESALPVEIVAPSDISRVWKSLMKLAEKVQELQTNNLAQKPLNDIITQLEKKMMDQNPLNDKVVHLEKRIVDLESENSKIRSEHQLLITSLDKTRIELNAKTDLLTKIMDQKEERFNEKLTQAKVEMSQARDKVPEILDEPIAKVEKIAQNVNVLTTNYNILDLDFKSHKIEIKQWKMEINQMTNDLKTLYTSQKSVIATQETERKRVEMKMSTMEAMFNAPLPVNLISTGLQQYNCLVYTWTVNGIRKKMEHTAFQNQSPGFTLNGYQFRGKAKLKLHNEQVYLSLSYDMNRSGKVMGLKVYPQVTFILKDRSGNENTKDTTALNNYLYSSTINYNEYNYEISLMNKSDIVNSPYAIDDSIVIDIYVESPYIAQQIYSNDGVLTCKIDNYKKKRAMAKTSFVCKQLSSYFYTSPNGYRMQVFMWLDGYGAIRGKGLSAQITFLTGEFDSSLTWPFNHKTTLTIFNQTDSTKHLVKTIERNKEANEYYFIDISESEVESVLLYNDSLIYRVVVQAL